jgi:hypothetical protein
MANSIHQQAIVTNLWYFQTDFSPKIFYSKNMDNRSRSSHHRLLDLHSPKPERLTDPSIAGRHTDRHYGNNMLTPRSRSQTNHSNKDEDNNSLSGLVSAASHRDWQRSTGSASRASGQKSSTSLALESQKEQYRTVTPPLSRQSQAMSMVLLQVTAPKLLS